MIKIEIHAAYSFSTFRPDNSVWMKFGKENMASDWNAANEYTDAHTYELISQQEINALKDFDFIDFEVCLIFSQKGLTY